MDDIKSLKYLVRMPNDVYRAKVDNYVKHQKAQEPSYSLNDFWLEAGRALIDAPMISHSQSPVISQPQAPAPRPSPPKPKGWLADIQRWAEMREVDPEEAAREESQVLIGFKAPKGWLTWSSEQRAAYLDVNFPKDGTIPAASATEITKPTLEQPGRKRTAAELAASIPGLSVGFGGSSAAPSKESKPEPPAPEPDHAEVEGW